MQELFDWELIASFTGATAAAAIITEFIKKLTWELLPNSKIPTFFISYLLSVALVNIAAKAMNTWNWQSLALSFVNGMVISFAANGLHDNIAALSRRTTLKEKRAAALNGRAGSNPPVR